MSYGREIRDDEPRWYALSRVIILWMIVYASATRCYNVTRRLMTAKMNIDVGHVG